MENIDFEKFLKEMDNENLYSILRIGKEADPKELRTAFKKVIKECHPDKVVEHLKDDAAKKFQKIQKVYNFLKNHLNRDQYNKHLGHLEERKVRTDKMNKERRKFQEDLIKRENEGKDTNGQTSPKTKEKTRKEKHKKHKDDISYDNNHNNDDTHQRNNDYLYYSIVSLII